MPMLYARALTVFWGDEPLPHHQRFRRWKRVEDEVADAAPHPVISAPLVMDRPYSVAETLGAVETQNLVLETPAFCRRSL